MTAIAASNAHSLALKSDGSVLAWGCGGIGNYGQRTVPAGALSGVTAIAAGDLPQPRPARRNGSVLAWGCARSAYGQCTVPAGARAA